MAKLTQLSKNVFLFLNHLKQFSMLNQNFMAIFITMKFTLMKFYEIWRVLIGLTLASKAETERRAQFGSEAKELRLFATLMLMDAIWWLKYVAGELIENVHLNTLLL